MDVVLASDIRPLESVTVAVNVIVPEVFKNPVVSVSAVPEYSTTSIPDSVGRGHRQYQSKTHKRVGVRQ